MWLEHHLSRCFNYIFILDLTLASMGLAKTTARWDEKHLSVGIWCTNIRGLTIFNFSFHTLPADGRALFSLRGSAEAVMTKFGFCMYAAPALKGISASSQDYGLGAPWNTPTHVLPWWLLTWLWNCDQITSPAIIRDPDILTRMKNFDDLPLFSVFGDNSGFLHGIQL